MAGWAMIRVLDFFFSGCSVKPVEDFKPGNASDLNYILVDWMKNG